MFKNKSNHGNNISGEKIKKLRLNSVPVLSQRELADKLQLLGVDLDKNAIQRIESGKRFITDIELKAFSSYYNVSADTLLGRDRN